MTCSMQELLVALKHVLGTDFKRGLFPLIDTLLEERYYFKVSVILLKYPFWCLLDRFVVGN